MDPPSTCHANWRTKNSRATRARMEVLLRNRSGLTERLLRKKFTRKPESASTLSKALGLRPGFGGRPRWRRSGFTHLCAREGQEGRGTGPALAKDTNFPPTLPKPSFSHSSASSMTTRSFTASSCSHRFRTTLTSRPWSPPLILPRMLMVFHPINVAKLAMDDPTGFVPCTPRGCMRLLQRKWRRNRPGPMQSWSVAA